MSKKTWGEFKKMIEEAGITDEWNISYIDVDDFVWGITLKKDEENKWFSVT